MIAKKWSLLTLAVVYSLLQTAHFGWNITAHTDAEVVADGISALLYALVILA